MNERALREVKSQLEQVQRRVLEVSPVVVASANTNTEDLRRLQVRISPSRPPSPPPPLCLLLLMPFCCGSTIFCLIFPTYRTR